MSDQSHKQDCKHRNNLNQGFTNVNHVYMIVTIFTISIFEIVLCVYNLKTRGSKTVHHVPWKIVIL